MDEKMSATHDQLAVQMRRQMRSGQMARFVRALPGFRVEPDLPSAMARLLHAIDNASRKARTANDNDPAQSGPD
jgi:hypothetical protein